MANDIYTTVATALKNTGEMPEKITPKTSIGKLSFFGYMGTAFDIKRETGVSLGEPFYNNYTTVGNLAHYIARLKKKTNEK